MANACCTTTTRFVNTGGVASVNHLYTPFHGDETFADVDVSALIGLGWTVMGTDLLTPITNTHVNNAAVQMTVALDSLAVSNAVHAIAVWRSWGYPATGGAASPSPWVFPSDPVVQRQGADRDFVGHSASIDASAICPSVTALPSLAVVVPGESFNLEIGVAIWVDAAHVGPDSVQFEVMYQGALISL